MSRLSPADFARAIADYFVEGGAEDEPPDFPGKPLTGGGMVPMRTPAQDAAYATRFPATRRIGADDGIGRQPAPRPAVMSAADRERYDRMFPSSRHIGIA